MSLARSWFIVPGDDDEAVRTARESAADVTIIDLEDTVAPADKDAARSNAVDRIDRWSDLDQTCAVRVNGLDSTHGVADVEAFVDADATPDLLFVPDVRGGAEIEVVDDVAADLDGSVGVVPILERPTAVLNAHEIATASARVDALTFGSVDFQMNMGMSILDDDTDVTLPRYVVSMAAHAVDVLALDTVYLSRDDEAGLRADAAAAKRLGYDGKIALTTDQIAPINDVFSPSADDARRARRLVDQFEQEPGGMMYFEDTFVDKPVVDEQRNLLDRADAAGVDY